MKVAVLVLLTLAIHMVGYSQSSDLHEKLEPSDYAKQEAERLDAKVFKMLPRHLLEKAEPRDDSESVLGVRGNGAFYSFSTQTHSWNNLGELVLAAGELHVGTPYGMISNLGRYPLNRIAADSEIRELKALSSYRPPTNAEEQELEQKSKAERRKLGILIGDRSPATVGHTYIFRAIRPVTADILVAFTIIRAEKDGSLEIAWKLLNQFIKPAKIYLSDLDLTAAIQKVIDENGIFKTIGFRIKGNKITLTGATTRHEFDLFVRLIEPFRTRGIDAQSVTEIKSP